MSFFVRTPKPPVAHQAPAYGAMRVQSSCYGGVITAGFGTTRLTGNMIWSGDFQSHAHSSGGGGGGGGGGKGGGGGGGGGGSTTYTYSTSLAMALAQGPVKGVGVIWKGKEIQALGPLGGSLFEGSPGQAPWGYLSSKHPDQTLGYSDTAYVGFADFDLGESNSMPNLSFETMMLGPPATRRQSAASGFIVPGLAFDLGDGVFDAEMTAAVDALVDEILADLADGKTPVWDTHFAWAIKHLLTAPFGPQFPAAHVGNFSLYATYCHAHGFAMSTALQEARPSNEMLDEWVRSTVAEFVWSDGLLKIVPYGMEQVAGNGVVYVPDPTPVYDLGPDDFIINQGEGGGEGDDIGGGAVPVTVRRKNLADTYNRVKVEFLDRANSYNVAVAVAEDPAHIATFGLREAPVMKCHWFAEAEVAQLAAELALYRHLNVTTEFEFPLGWRHVLLEPMDLVTLTEPETGLELELVCVTEIEEDDEGRLMAKAENVPDGVSIPPARVAFQLGASFSLDLNADPGDVEDAVLFEPPMQLTGGSLEIWIGACGGTDWAGCEVWVSADDTSYRRAGIITAPARIGTLTAPLPAAADPDAINTLSVDLTVSRGQLLNATQAEADGLDTLCWADGELIAYRDAVLTGAYAYDLSYLRRAAYGTSTALHAGATQFLRLDGAVARFPYTVDQIGRTLWVKLPSFNAFGGGLQDLSELESYQIVIQGPVKPPGVADFLAQQNGGVVVFSWKRVTWAALAGYDIAFGPKGCALNVSDDQAWAAMQMLTEEAKGTEMTNAAVAPGDWTFGIRPRDVVGQLGPLTTVDLTVVNVQTVVYAPQQAPAWTGVLSGLLRHYNGVLVVDSAKPADQHTNEELFEQFVPYPVANPSYETPVIDMTVVDEVRVWAEISAGLRGVEGNVSVSFGLDWSADNLAWNGVYQTWNVGSVSARYIKGKLSVDTSLGACVITGMAPTVDVPIKTETITVTVASGGGHVGFNRPRHQPPTVNAGAGAGCTSASATNVTTTGCLAHGWTGATDAGGTITLTITGP